MHQTGQVVGDYERASTGHPQTRYPVFIVGNSRSGTTMIGRILGNNPSIFTMKELHFFEQLWSPSDDARRISQAEAVRLAARLVCIQRDGYLNQGDPSRFLGEAREIVASGLAETPTPAEVFEAFLLREAKNNGKVLPCDHTPRNVLYIGEILRLYPGSRIINMVRDPRDVLLSQKRKWKRHYLGDKSPVKEAIRSWVNYHPITISKLWNASVRAASRFEGDDRVLTLRFEDLTSDPEGVIFKVCEFVSVSFDKAMLEIPQVGSSSESDHEDQKGINCGRVGSWRKEGLNSTEVFWCQRITDDLMRQYGYSLAPAKPDPLYLVWSLISLPIKLTLALVLNLNRMRSITETIKRRLV